jgi:phage terminase Nu1 subunit (DNA packaging protein)
VVRGQLLRIGESVDYAKTQDELAIALEVSPATLFRWRAQGMPMGKAQPGYSIDKARRWIRKHAAQVKKKAEAKKNGGHDGERGRLLTLKEELAEVALEERKYKLQLLRSSYRSEEESRRRDVARLHVLKRGLLNLPKAVAPDLLGLNKTRDFEAVLLRHVERLIRSWLEMSRKRGKPTTSADDETTSAKLKA